jgi:hypothetical protein
MPHILEDQAFLAWRYQSWIQEFMACVRVLSQLAKLIQRSPSVRNPDVGFDVPACFLQMGGEGFAIDFRLEADQQLAAAELQHRPLD